MSRIETTDKNDEKNNKSMWKKMVMIGDDPSVWVGGYIQ